MNDNPYDKLIDQQDQGEDLSQTFANSENQSNPYGDLVAKDEQRLQQLRQASGARSSTMPANKAKEIDMLAKESGVAPEIAAKVPEKIRSRLIARRVAQDLAEFEPEEQEYLAQKNRIEILQDDLPRLRDLVRSTRDSGLYIPKPEQTEERGLLENTGSLAAQRFEEGTANLVAFIDNVSKQAAGEVYDQGFANPTMYVDSVEALREQGREVAFEMGGYGVSFSSDEDPRDQQGILQPAAEWIDRQADYWQYEPTYTADRIKQNATAENVLGFIFEQGVGSLGEAPLAALGLPAFAAQTIQRVAEERVQADERNTAPTLGDYLFAGPTGTAVAGLERFGLSRLFNPVTKTPTGTIVGGAGREGTLEFGQENLEYLGSNLATEQGYDPLEGAERGAFAALAGFGVGGGIGAGQQVYESVKQYNKARRDEGYLNRVADASRAAQESDNVDQENIRELIKRAEGNAPIRELYIDAESFATLAQDAGLDPDQLAQSMPSVGDAFREARNVGGEFSVRISDFAASIANTDMSAGFIKKARTSTRDDALSAEEAERWYNESAAPAIERALSQPDDEIALETIQQRDMGQLMAAGQDRGTAENTARLRSQLYFRMAKMLNRDPVEFYEEYGANIQREQGEANRPRRQPDEMDSVLERLRARDIPTETDAYGERLLDFIRSSGGVTDAGGEFAARDIDAGRQPGQRNIIREDGVAPDDMARMAVDSGYLLGLDTEAVTERELLEAVDAELRGEPRFSQSQVNEDRAEQRRALMELQEFLDNQGIDIDAMSNQEIRDMLNAQEPATAELDQNVVNAVSQFEQRRSKAEIAELKRKAQYVYRQGIADQLAPYEPESGDSLLETWFNYQEQVADQQAQQEQERLNLTDSELADRYVADIQQALQDSEGTTPNARDLVRFYGQMGGELDQFLEAAQESGSEIAFQARRFINDRRAAQPAATETELSPTQQALQNALYMGRDTVLADGGLDVDVLNAIDEAVEEGVISEAEADAIYAADWIGRVGIPLNDSDQSQVINDVNSTQYFHGTNAETTDLQFEDGQAFFIASEQDAAQAYGERIVPVTANVQRPLFVETGDTTADIDSGTLAQVKEAGYDSIVPLDGGDVVILEESALSLVDSVGVGEPIDTDSVQVEMDDRERLVLTDPENPGMTLTADYDPDLQTTEEYAGAYLEIDPEFEVEDIGGRGTATKLYLRALKQAQEMGIGWRSDSVQSNPTQTMYQRLTRLGVPFTQDSQGRYVIEAESLMNTDLDAIRYQPVDRQATTSAQLQQDDIPQAEVIEDETSAEEFNRLLEQARAATQADRQQQAGQVSARTLSGGQADQSWRTATSAVNRDGSPTLLYRGESRRLSPADFEPGARGYSTGNPNSGLGVFMTNRVEDTARYGDNRSQWFLDMRNPAVFMTDDVPEFASLDESIAFRDALEAQGYDGIVFDYTDADPGAPKHFMVFNPDQVIDPDTIPVELNQDSLGPDEKMFIGSQVNSQKKVGRRNTKIGEFDARQFPDGSIGIIGNAKEIRGKLPYDIIGREVSNGIMFTAQAAPRVRGALEGRAVSVSRAGQVTRQIPRDKNGNYVGAPDRFNTPGKIGKLRRVLRQLADEGKKGRFWYENSGRAVLRMTQGDVREAKKFVALLSIYSPQAKVDSNTTFALRAWAQYRAGRPISVKTGVQDRKATQALENIDKFWSGEKTGNFYLNLLREIDPTTEADQGATIDMWMMRAGQYSTDAPTQTQYAFMENETNRVAQELGWEPQQVQAAIWVGMKARMENKQVKIDTERKSARRGWITTKEGKNGVKKRDKIVDQPKHQLNWIDTAMKHELTEADTNQSKFDFEDGLKRHIGQISVEARPSTKRDILPGIHEAPYEQQVEFQQAIMKAMQNETGVDEIAAMLGLMVESTDILAPGVWEAEVSPSSQMQVSIAPDAAGIGYERDNNGSFELITKKQFESLSPAEQSTYTKRPMIDMAQKDLLDVYSATLGLLMRQDGVGYHRPFYGESVAKSNAAEARLGRPMTPDEAQALYGELDSRMRERGIFDWGNSVGIISTGEGVRFVNFGAVGNNRDFHAIVEEASTAAIDGDIEVGYFFSDGALAENDWRVDTNGQNYVKTITAAGRSDVLERARDVLAPRLQAVYTDFAERYGWGEPGSLTAELEAASATTESELRNRSGISGSSRVLEESSGQASQSAREADGSLQGLPRNVGQFQASVFDTARKVAQQYMDNAGLDYTPPNVYATVDRARAERIAEDFDRMEHNPADPDVRESYQAMIDETIAQYQAVMETGLEVEFIDFDTMGDPYDGNPRAMTEDVRVNNHMYVFSTRDGFGSSEMDVSDNPLLQETDFEISGQTALANDLFRVVHDYFGHVKEGVGFRANGEENAWRAHSAMYSPTARKAMTTETRGQNSWVNFGPYGETNRTAGPADTVYADQKIGLLPDYAVEEGAGDTDIPTTLNQDVTESQAFQQWFGDSKVVDENGEPLVVYHGTAREFDAFDTEYGAFFSDDKSAAEFHASMDQDRALENALDEDPDADQEDLLFDISPIVNEFYLSFQNPLRLDSQDLPQDAYSNNYVNFQTQAKEDGYDSLIIDGGPEGTEFIAFSPEQIKSATDNTGAFDPANPSTLEQRQEQGRRGAFFVDSMNRASIMLGEASDLSTIPHETMHEFLELYAQFQNDSPEIAEQVQKVREWLVRNPQQLRDDAMMFAKRNGADTADIEAMTDEEIQSFYEGFDMRLSQVPESGRERWLSISGLELFARGGEAYLREGRAPTENLVSVFQRMKNWFLQVYRNARALNVQLDDGIREVFDRMLATEVEIEQAREAANMDLSMLEIAGIEWSEEERQTLSDLMTQSKADAENQLMRDQMADMNKQEQDWWKQKSQEVRNEILAELNRQQRYQLRQMLTAGKRADGTDLPENVRQIKLDRQAIVEEFGESELKRLPSPRNNDNKASQYPYAREGGLDPAVVARMYGFKSAREMLDSLIASRPVKAYVDSLVASEMRARYPDINLSGEAVQKAAQVVHNDKRGQVMVAELKKLESQSRMRPTLPQMLRNKAREMLAGKTSRQIQPNLYKRQVNKYAREAFNAAGEGNFQQAVDAKRKELIHHYMYREAIKSREEADKMYRYAKRLQKKSAQERIGKAGGGYLERINELLAQYEFRRLSNKELQRRKDLEAWVTEKTQNGEHVNIPPEIIERANQPTNWRDVPIAELEGLRDTLKNLEHTAKVKNKLLSSAEERDIQEVLDPAVEQVETLGTKRGRRGLEQRKWWKTLGKEYATIALNIDSLIRDLDGGKDLGPVYRITKGIIDKAARSDLPAKQKEFNEQLTDIYNTHYTREEQRGFTKDDFLKVDGRGYISREQALSVALNWGNEYNREALMIGKWSGYDRLEPNEIKQILNGLDKRDWDFAQDVWDMLDNDLWPQVKAAQKRRTGIAPEKVEASPVETKFGVYRGGYYPIKFDTGASWRVTAQEADDMAQEVRMGGFAQAQTKRGFTKERTSTAGKPLMLDLGVLHGHVNGVATDLALGDAVNDVSKLIARDEFRAAMEQTDNQWALEVLNNWLKDVAAQEQIGSDIASRFARRVRVGFTISKLAWNIGTIALQPTGLAQSLPSIGYRNMLSGLSSLGTNKWVGEGNIFEQIEQKSTFMATRSQTFNKDIQVTQNALKGSGLIEAAMERVPVLGRYSEKGSQLLKDSLMGGIVATQKMVDATVWLGAYEKGKQNFDNDADAIQYADNIVARTQASGVFSDRTAFERGTLNNNTRQSEFVRLWTVLGSYMFAKGNVMYQITRNTNFRDPVEIMKYVHDFAMLFVFEAIFIGVMRNTLPGEDDEETVPGRLAKDVGLSVMSTMPLVRDAASTLSGFQGGGALGSFYEEIGMAGKQVSQWEADPALFKSLNDIGGVIFRYPSGQINRMGESLWRDINGEEAGVIDYLLWREKED